MKFLLLGGKITNIIEQNVFSNCLKSNDVKKLLYLGITAEDQGKKKYERLITLDRKINEYSPELFNQEDYISGDVNFEDYDAIHIPGGSFEAADKYLNDNIFRTDILKWFDSENSKVFIGSSFGAKMLCDRYFNWSTENLEKTQIVDNGLGILKNILIDVHFSQYNLQSRMRTALAQHPEIKLGIGIDEGSYITGELQNGKFEVGQMFGGVHFYRQV